jgi:hypothetical protein
MIGMRENAFWAKRFPAGSKFELERRPRFRVGKWNSNNQTKHIMQYGAARFREYAAECRHLAEQAGEKEKAVLMEIAAVWIVCAEEAERKQPSGPRNV